jgi:hypothetical protein
MWSDSDYSQSGDDEEEEQNNSGFAFGRAANEEGEEEELTPVEIVDFEHDFDDLDKDVLGDDDGADSDDNAGYKAKPKKGLGRKAEKKKEEERSFMLFDFRRGDNRWPEGAELVDDKLAKELLETAQEEAAKAKDKDVQIGPMKMEGFGSSDMAVGGTSVGSYGGNNAVSWDEDLDSSSGAVDTPSLADAKDPDLSPAPAGAKFETMKDRSTALIVPPGHRLKLNLADLLKGGDAKKEEVTTKKKQNVYSLAHI